MNKVIAKTRKQNNNNLEKSCFTLFFYFTVKTLFTLYRNSHSDISASQLTLTVFLPYKMFDEKIHHNILSCT